MERGRIKLWLLLYQALSVGEMMENEGKGKGNGGAAKIE